MVKEKFYITTAIDYLNAEPHIGHAYQKIIADVLSRWHKLLGKEVFFLTGVDEHGQKVAKSAALSKKPPKEFVDQLSKKFKEAWKILNIDYCRFMRTTDEDHKELVLKFIEKIKKDIYKGVYEGMYCEGCEAYITGRDLINEECPYHPGKKLQKLKEDTYFFKLSKYQDKLLKLYKENPDYILPRKRAKEIINRVEQGLKDLSITRSNVEWGIPYPYDENHVIYVWFDALLNYLTGIGWPHGNFDKYWPANLELLGVDNSWFHTVIWPAMLMSAGIDPPKTIFVHGFLTFNGTKISKSLGNVISPKSLVEKYGADGIRYFICRNFVLGEDGDFDEKALKARYHDELADKLGNLVSRVCGLIHKNFSGKLDFGIVQDELIDQLQLDAIKENMENLKLDRALALIFSYIDACNIFIQEKKPWEEKDKKKVKDVLYTLVESLRVISILLSSFMPETCEKIRKQFNFKEVRIEDCKFGISKSTTIKEPIILFKKLE